MHIQETRGSGGLSVIVFLAFLVVVGGICYWYSNQDSHDDPENDGYTPISTAQELMDMGKEGKYKLVNDVDVSAIAWIPIDEFKGELDGRGFKITGLNIENNDSSVYAGMFRVLLEGGRVHDLTLDQVNVRSTYSGAIAGSNQGTVEKVVVSGFVGKSNGLYCGGIVGTNKGTVADSRNDSTVSGQEGIGGICGFNSGGTVKNCENYGTISGAYKNSGGIAGWNKGDIVGSTNLGPIESKGDYVGGICGTNEKSVRDSVNKGRVSGADYVAGCIASSSSKVENLKNLGDVEGNNYVAGYFAIPSSNSGCAGNTDSEGYTVTGTKNVGGMYAYMKNHNFNSGSLHGVTVIGCENVGGIVGSTYGGYVKNTEFKGSILSQSGDNNDSFGGIAGYASSTDFQNCISYATVNVDANTVGGIVGYGYHLDISNCMNYGEVKSSCKYVAGIMGYADYFCSVNYCSNEATIRGYDYVAGIANGRATLKANSNVGLIIVDKPSD